MANVHNIIAQGRDFDWSNLLYILVILVFPALNALSEWIRGHFNKKADEKKGSKGGKEYEVVIEDGEIVLKPQQPKPKLKTAQSATTSQPMRAEKPGERFPRPGQAGVPAPQRSAPRPAPKPQRPAPASPRPAPKPQRPAPVRPAPQARPTQQPRRPQQPPQRAAPAPSRRAEVPADPRAIMAAIIEEDVERRQTRKKPAEQAVRGRDLEWDHQSVRRAIVMKEILGPPIALRNRDDDALF